MTSHRAAGKLWAGPGAIPDAIVLVDEDGRIAVVNPAGERLFGYGHDDLVGQPIDLLIPGPLGGAPDQLARKKDGTQFPVEIALRRVPEGTGTLTITSIRDLTGPRAAEERLLAMFEAGPDALVVVDRAGRMVLVNARLEQLFGYTRAELLERPVDVLVPERFRGAHHGHVASYYRDPHPRAMGSGLELRGRRKDGSEFPLEISLTPVETADGTLVTAAIRDVSERTEREKQQLHVMESELHAESAARATSAEMNERLIVASMRDQEVADEVRAGSAAKSRFLAAMSHELRTPLNAIAGYSGLIEEGIAGPVTPLQLEYLRKVQQATRHLVGVIGDALDLAKVEAGQLQVERKPGQVADAVAGALDLIEPQAQAAGIALESETPPVAVIYEGDPDRVRQILLNLLSNAVKFTDSGGRVTVTYGVTPTAPKETLPGEGPWAFVAVADTGRGIGPADAARVFEPFNRVQQEASKKRPGTGLGLAISRELARRMGGDLTLRSVVGQGSCFTLWLPAGTTVDP